MWCWERFHFQHAGCLLVLWVALAAATGNVNSIDLLEPPHDSVADRSYIRKAKDLYMACMNEEQLARLGAKPIQDLVKGLKVWPSTQGTPLYLEPALAEVNELFEITASPLLNAFVYPDQLNRSNNIVWIEEGRTFLRRRDIPKDGQWSDSMLRTVQRFTALVNATLSPGDWTGNINKVMEFEIKLAKVPLVPYVPAFSCLVNIYLMFKLDTLTWIRFCVWMVDGFSVYFLYGINNATMSKWYSTSGAEEGGNDVTGCRGCCGGEGGATGSGDDSNDADRYDSIGETTP